MIIEEDTPVDIIVKLNLNINIKIKQNKSNPEYVSWDICKWLGIWQIFQKLELEVNIFRPTLFSVI